jgi:predicted aspartyl protease
MIFLAVSFIPTPASTTIRKKTRIHFKVYGANGKAADLEAVVDTGATFSKIPESIAAMLGLEAKYETALELLGLKVNPITGKLERAMPIEYRN